MTTDRDQSIERLLRRALPPDPHAPDRDCPDADTLAALADDTLAPATRREVEGHIADCHRCQAITAAIVRTDVPTSTPADEVAGEVPACRRRAFNWLVPAAAAATAIALWVLVPGQRTPLPEPPEPESQIAAAPPPLSSEVITSEPLQIPVDSPADTVAAERDANVGLQSAAPGAAARSVPPEVSRNFEASADGSGQAARQDSAQAPVAGGLQASGSPPPGGIRSENSAPVAQERRLGDAAAAAPAAPTAAIGSAAQNRAAAAFEVVSPDSRIRWRIGPGPVVQYSADGGATWAAQQTGASAELTAGSAPTPAVCWLVGRRGIVLRTTDGGRQWERVAFPETIDLNAVTASTALNAIVDLADGRRLATTDGGRTWAPARQ